MSSWAGKPDSPRNAHAGLPEALQVFQRFQDPRLRWCDVPGGELLLEARMLHPGDPYLADVHTCVEDDLLREALQSGDPFHGNAPAVGVLPHLGPGRVPIAALSTGDVLSIGMEDLTRNVLVVGPTGSGKSNFLRVLILAELACEV